MDNIIQNFPSAFISINGKTFLNNNSVDLKSLLNISDENAVIILKKIGITYSGNLPEISNFYISIENNGVSHNIYLGKTGILEIHNIKITNITFHIKDSSFQ